ncbi:GTP-binding protein, HSR1-related [Oleispira antarctica RB-8]|uniref:Ribosome biogenesis GTPase A n=1 Tax=Oleispira antarctica RB-8 TaxID=698738 RepID=R4YLZ9_OLEAN|nr:GTP-binding protein, HSR1-related [Oleispira antarctica RB-8]|tara:strand:+ start:382 stop:1338 length:957 start_codon:yes stop_codon:yes gene_type:complete
MAINWFPGHMNRARNQIEEAMPDIDLVVEVLDSRLPYSSTNPLVDELRVGKPCIKVLNKADLSDPKITKLWIEHFEKQDNTHALALVAEDHKQSQKLIQLIKNIVNQSEDKKTNIRVMIMGIPNVGKSTLINSLAGRYIANTGDEPAVTKRQQMIDLKNGVVLSDTPGILWPKFENFHSGYRLATSGAIKNTAMEYEDVAMYALEYLSKAYPEALMTRYKLEVLPESGESLLDMVARKRGCIRSGGKVDLHKAGEIVLHDFRSGKIGLLSLETPEMMVAEEIIAEELILAKELAKAERKRLALKGKRFQTPKKERPAK